MRNLCLDIGNSFTKAAVFDQSVLTHFSRFENFTLRELEMLLEEFKPQHVVISSVAEAVEPFEEFLKAHTQYKRFSTLDKAEVENNYETPTTLGLDRWAAILGANATYKNAATLVIDAGTCITYDLLTADRKYYGGSISPGINMRFKAINTFATRLPLVEWDAETEIKEGTDTETAIASGILQGTINEIKGFIASYTNKHNALKVIITGGDGNFLFKQLQNSIFAAQITSDPFLVLKGLNEAIVD
ncbi:type III pantothenate kinase [Pedobacter sp. UYP30]|uniref:type III pantothenate kinase n=1 Tax=Pedobacter sp. UYP30 TaxID=1756400 RepID=UPI00339A58B7